MFKPAIFLLFSLILVDWQFVVQGKMFMGEGSSSEAIYLRSPSIGISTQDSIVTSSGSGRKGTGVAGRRPPGVPPVRIGGFKKDLLYGINAGATARDLPVHLQEGQQIPPISDEELVMMTLRDKMSLFRFNIADDAAEKTGYGKVARAAMAEAFYDCFKILLRKNFVYNKTFDREDQFFLLLYGEPAASSILEQSGFKWDDFGPGDIDAEDRPLESIKKGDEFDKMMYKLISLELFGHYPFTYPFAPGLDNFPPELLYPYLKAIMTGTKNKRLRRNTVYYLGSMGKYEPLNDLLGLLKNDEKDKVVKARAIYFLTTHKFPGFARYLASRLEEEDDPVFRVAVINSLGRLGDKESFPVLVKMLEDVEPDYDTYMALIRAATRCMDVDDKSTVERFIKACKKLLEASKYSGWAKDPLSKHSMIHKESNQGLGETPGSMMVTSTGADISMIDVTTEGAVEGTRRRLLGQLIDNAIALSNTDKMEMKKTALKIKDAVRELMAGSEGGAELLPLERCGWDRVLRSFVVEGVGELADGGNNVGKTLLEQMLIKGKGNMDVLASCVDTYVQQYPGDFPKLAGILLDGKDRDIVVVDRVIRYLFRLGIVERRITKALKRIVAGYSRGMSYEEKHLVSLALFYLACQKGVGGKQVSRIIVTELAAGNGTEAPRVPGTFSALDFSITPPGQLLCVCIDSLGLLGTGQAESVLRKLARTGDGIIRGRVARALGNYRSAKTKDVLLDLLEDNAGWVRVAAYMSLHRITGKEYRVDWYSANGGKAKKHARKYRDIINWSNRG